MDVDWWARGIGIAALVLALAGVLLRLLEFLLSGRARIKVVGSAGTVQPTAAGLKLLRGKRFGYSLVVVDIINTGRRPVTIDTVGFRVPGSKRLTQLEPGVLETLPARLEPGERTTVTSQAHSFLENQIELPSKLRPYCNDAEGRTHLGALDHHFHQLVADNQAG